LKEPNVENLLARFEMGVDPIVISWYHTCMKMESRRFAKKSQRESLPEKVRLEDLLPLLSPENLHGEFYWGLPIGREIYWGKEILPHPPRR